MSSDLVDSELWRETVKIPAVVRSVISAFRDPSDQLSGALDLLRSADRIVATGNGAAYYAALAMESASRVLGAPVVVPVPAGIIAARAVTWRPDDVTVVVSASGELRDVVQPILNNELPRPWVAITMTPGSTIGVAADARIDVPVPSQNSVTHTQAYVANVLSAILTAAAVSGRSLAGHLDLESLAERLEGEIEGSIDWATETASAVREDETFRLAFASGAGHVAALETALLMKEVCGQYVEGFETREAATTGMYALRRGDLVLSHTRADDPLAEEAESVLEGMGARAIRLPLASSCSALELPILGFPAAVALAGSCGLRAGRDIDAPEWTSSYYQTARVH